MRLTLAATILILASLLACPIHIVKEVPDKELVTSEDITGYYNTMQVYSEGTYSPDEVGLALFLFYELWVEEFRDDNYRVHYALDNLIIIWMPEDWIIINRAYGEDGKLLDNSEGILVSGLAHNDTGILVSKGNGNLWETSFVHELIHVALKASTGSTDPDHLGNKYPGWTMKHSNLIETTNLIIEYTMYQNKE